MTQIPRSRPTPKTPQTVGSAPCSTIQSGPFGTGDSLADRASAVRRQAVARRFTGAAVALLLLSPLASTGCSEKDSARKHRQLEGTITNIDLDNAKVTLRFYSEKHKAETTVTGRVTPKTEVFINGQLSSLKDLREGERVSVVGWVQGRSADREVVAVKVTVERAETIRKDAASDPTNAGRGSGAAGGVPGTAGGTPSPAADQPDAGGRQPDRAAAGPRSNEVEPPSGDDPR